MGGPETRVKRKFHQCQTVRQRVVEITSRMIENLVKIKSRGDCIQRGAKRGFETTKVVKNHVLADGSLSTKKHNGTCLWWEKPAGCEVSAREIEGGRD